MHLPCSTDCAGVQHGRSGVIAGRVREGRGTKFCSTSRADQTSAPGNKAQPACRPAGGQPADQVPPAAASACVHSRAARRAQRAQRARSHRDVCERNRCGPGVAPAVWYRGRIVQPQDLRGNNVLQETACRARCMRCVCCTQPHRLSVLGMLTGALDTAAGSQAVHAVSLRPHASHRRPHPHRRGGCPFPAKGWKPH